MNPFDLPPLNIAALSVMAWVLIDVIATGREARETCGRLRAVQGQIDRELGPLLAHAPIARVKRKVHELSHRIRPRHPSLVLAASVLRFPEVAHDPRAVQSWIDRAVSQVLPSQRRLFLLRRMAPTLGLAGTVLGLCGAAFAFGDDADQGRMMSSVALAFLTTLLGAGTAAKASHSLGRHVDPLVEELDHHALFTSIRTLNVGSQREPAGRLEALQVLQAAHQGTSGGGSCD